MADGDLWSITGNLVGLGLLPVKPGSAHVPLPGYDVQVVDAAAHPVATGQMGSLVVKLPLPPGCLPTLWQHDAEMVESYLSEFPGFYKSGDAGYRDADGYFYIMSRTDDIMNVRGPSPVNGRHGRGAVVTSMWQNAQ